MANVLVLNGHPLEPSFAGAAAQHYGEVARTEGATVRHLDLAALVVPELTSRKPGDDEMTGDVARFWEDMVWADHVVIVHPLWWGSMPAKLKALFDIALQSGKAYRYRPNNPLPLGLLAGRSARLIVTSDTPNRFMAIGYCNAHFRTVKNQILRFIGLAPVRKTHLSVMRGATDSKRRALLDRVGRVARTDAARLLARPRTKPHTPQPA